MKFNQMHEQPYVVNEQTNQVKKKTKHGLAEAWIRESESKIYEVYPICSITYLNKQITYLIS